MMVQKRACILSSKTLILGFPDGSGVQNLPANAGDRGSGPDLGKSHVPQSNEARVLQLLSLSSRAWEPQLLSPHTAAAKPGQRAHAPGQKKSHQPGAQALQQIVASTHHN